MSEWGEGTDFVGDWSAGTDHLGAWSTGDFGDDAPPMPSAAAAPQQASTMNNPLFTKQQEQAQQPRVSQVNGKYASPVSLLAKFDSVGNPWVARHAVGHDGQLHRLEDWHKADAQERAALKKSGKMLGQNQQEMVAPAPGPAALGGGISTKTWAMLGIGALAVGAGAWFWTKRKKK